MNNVVELDIRKTKNARWFDQKCKVDVVYFVANCILSYTQEHELESFFVADIKKDKQSQDEVKKYFTKPELGEAPKEYDKFYAQPMKLLCYAGILNEKKEKGKNFYTIIKYQKLRKIAISLENTCDFLNEYIIKTLQESNFYEKSNIFFW